MTRAASQTNGPRYVLGFDMGGTKTRAALANKDGELLAEASAPTVRWTGQPDYGEGFSRLANSLLEPLGLTLAEVGAAAIGVAGIVDPKTNRVSLAPYISDTEFDLLGPIE